jgi:hypothetical protein
MADSYLDHIPSQEREKIRKRLRSPEEYERFREKVKGPEDLEREMEKNADFAEVKLGLETEPKMQEAAKASVQEFVANEGLEAALEHVPVHAKEAIKKGAFDVTVDAARREPKLAIKLKATPAKGASEVATGKVQEVFPLKSSLQQQILSSLKI